MSKETLVSIPFEFSAELVLRTPAIPFISHLPIRDVNALLEDIGFMEAIYFATPVLHAECMRLKEGQIHDEKEARKVMTSLVKYYQRMYSRCTPFGLFSGCTVVQWGEGSRGTIIPRHSFSRSTRLDMHYLCALCQHISAIPEVQERLLFYPNNSAYRIGDELRYVEYRYRDGRRQHQISSVAWSEYLEAVMEKSTAGVLLVELAAMLIELANVTAEEANEFIQDMVNSQVLISETDPAITGEEFIHQLLVILKRINNPPQNTISKLISSLDQIVKLLKKADTSGNNDIEIYKSLIRHLQELGVGFEENKLLQTDIFSQPSEKTVTISCQHKLTEALDILSRLYIPPGSSHLTSFAERYRERYEDRIMPLLQVLDSDTGIGFPEQSGTNLSPLLDNMVLPPARSAGSYDIKWNKTEQWLFTKLLSNSEKTEVEITAEDLKELANDHPDFPPSLAVVFSIAEGEQIVFRGASGSSAVNLLGRFAHAEAQIKELADKIARAEEERNPDVVFAEIVHLPEDRAGNILLHPAFREWEIPYLARSSKAADKQIPLQDIVVQVQQDKSIHLFSKKLQREIIPRLSNAHNYSFRSLPVYHFLAEMQTCRLCNGLNWNWGVMAGHFKKLPRVRYGSVILSEACWQLKKADLELLLAPQGTIEDKMAAFTLQWKLPAHFVLADGDNELLVDTGNPLSSEAFIKTIRGRDAILLKEFFAPSGTAVTDEKGEAYCNQFVGILMNKKPVYNNAARFRESASSIKRSFLPGSEWLYYQVYCGTKSADEILLSVIFPLSQQLLERKLINKWFFIRYNDPGFHLRVRLQLSDTIHATQVMQLLLPLLEQKEQEGQVWKTQVSTYHRETERYGDELTALAEELFYLDSCMKMEFLQATEGDEREKQRWLWALRGVDELLMAFNYTTEKKYAAIAEMQKQFAREFNADKMLYRQLNQQFNNNRTEINMVMERPVSTANPLYPLTTIYEKYNGEIKTVADAVIGYIGDSESALNNLLSSYIHMNLNRAFLSEPRLHEMVIYDMLCTYYRAALKRKNA